MISTAAEYYQYLYRIQDKNKPTTAILLPSDETIYKVDLNTREIEAPQFLSVKSDHTAETIYFKMARFHDNIDLSNMTCVVQYKNANKEDRIYVVPFYDIVTFSSTNEMLVPWCIEGGVTAAAGKVEYSLRFFQVRDKDDGSGWEVSYNLSTLSAYSEVLYGMNPIDNNEVYDYDAAFIEEVLGRLNQLEGNYELYWLELF